MLRLKFYLAFRIFVHKIYQVLNGPDSWPCQVMLRSLGLSGNIAIRTQHLQHFPGQLDPRHPQGGGTQVGGGDGAGEDVGLGAEFLYIF